MSSSLSKRRREALFASWPLAKQIEAIIEQLAEMTKQGKAPRAKIFDDLLAEIEAIKLRHSA
jgi:hypothetical protein